jgi:hypothetical protein
MTTKCYLEQRKAATRGNESLVADAMRHLYTRQHLGKAVIICDQPLGLSGAARKQWLRLSRNLQKQRASTLNAEKILKYTHSITRMQHMHFSAKSPLDNPEADIYFCAPLEPIVMPVHCWSVYVLSPLNYKLASLLPPQLPAEALIIDYYQTAPWLKLGLQPKKVLESHVASQWRQVQQFLQSYNINPDTMIADGIHDVEAIDDALDTLLSMSRKFLEVAGEFQRCLELARPLRLSKEVRASYDALSLLAHRVQALSSGAFSQHFLETYNEDDTFFLYDPARKRFMVAGETLAEAFARHTNAGRHHLARSLRVLASAVS